MDVRSETQVCSRLIGGIAGSNPAEFIDFVSCVPCVLCR